ncbi:MAG: DUF1015 domain-containing protein [Bryobacterales bacterium]|nr:DUF1015 domain-containing protein [Bryobacterales bacterium]
MAAIYPFQAYRYSPGAGRLDDLVTQPYDKITPAMRTRYLAASPYNLVRIILGESRPDDHSADNVYTRAAAYLEQWIRSGILARDPRPALFAYSQEFEDPDTGERLLRQGFIAAGALEDYSAGVVHRHEHTLSGPKQDRLELLRHTRAHFGQIFMLYPDPEGAVDRILDGAAPCEPPAQVQDEYGAIHRLRRIDDPAAVRRVQDLMADKKLLIADGHHRYETALAFHRENPSLPGADRAMMTFVNMHSPGLRILATHRVVGGLPDFDLASFLQHAAGLFRVRPVDSPEELQQAWAGASPDQSLLGVAAAGRLYCLEPARSHGRLDVTVLHEDLIQGVLGISPEAVREQRNLRYVRGMQAALLEVAAGAAQLAFLLRPVTVEQVARIAFSGGVMPQKSTDFYPKLLSGLTMYRVGEPA